MRVLMVSPDFSPTTGGIQTYAAELARRLAGSCEDFALLVPAAHGRRAIDPGWVVRHKLGREVLPASAILDVARLGPRFDVAFHVSWHTAPSSLVCRGAGWAGRVFVAAHGLELIDEPSPGRLRLHLAARSIRRSVLARADGLLPVSRYTADLLVRAGADPQRIRVVHNGVDPEVFHPMDPGPARRRLNVEGRKVLFTVARLVPRKGIDTVLEAMPEILAAVPEAVYLVAGDGPDADRLAGLVRARGLADRVRFVGRCSDEELLGLYAACDVFVMPARQEGRSVEGFGIVFLEASACERPVIGARSGGVPEAIRDGETGLLVPPSDPSALAAAVVRILEDPALARKLGAGGRALAVGEASWDAVARRLQGAIAELSAAPAPTS